MKNNEFGILETLLVTLLVLVVLDRGRLPHYYLYPIWMSPDVCWTFSRLRTMIMDHIMVMLERNPISCFGIIIC
jgi:hypothetical protein